MESLNDPLSIKNPLRLERDSDKSRNCNGPSKQRGSNDNPESVFTSASNELDANSTSQNGPLQRHSNSLNNESSQSCSKASDSKNECNKNTGGATQGNKVNNCNTEQVATPGCSKSDTADSNAEPATCSKHKLCIDKAANNSAVVASTSGTSKPVDNAESSSSRENRKRPSTLKLNRPNFDDDDSSSDTGNDDYSLGSEDGCIYTYRGGEHLADLPSSFFSLDMGLPLDRHLPPGPLNYPAQQGAQNAREQNSRASSPDMDFLEMDFDPGPSCEVDSGDESSPDADLEAEIIMPEENEPVLRGTSPEYLAGARYVPPPISVPTTSSAPDASCSNVPSTSRSVPTDHGDVRDDSRSSHLYGPLITHVNVRGEQLLVRRTMSHWPHSTSVNLHVSSGDLVSPREMLNYDDDTEGPFAHQINQGERPMYDSANLSSALYHLTMAKKLVENAKADTDQPTNYSEEGPSTSSDDSRCTLPPRCMVWSEREACERQVTQIGTSACGATAVVNVFIALGVPVNVEKINTAVGTRLRANTAPLPRYLLSRAVAGCTAADLVTGIQRASDGLVTARFFPTYPERAVSLSHWLADWISLGAVPIVTLNLQVGCEGEIPDAWHHQMVFGVSAEGVYLCNPVECVPESTLWPRLTSPSVLLVRTRDVLSRFTASTDLSPLMFVPDRRFHTFNVLGQVANVIREWRSTGWSEHGTRTRHVRLPCAYTAGVTLAALTGSEAHRRLVHAAQLPILGPAPER
ncbi:uncharacterized protein LOC114351214 isoform X2 [Ostrinia furnacalis]|uniref:uncharacterized protein LOC114351214 isoform X2 n=1 Tax=Ostrinia furnacalis TaxID=93504 RepID=UPI00103DCAEE|nr:uncharacterized protein LOC114351214 isoform X2 [Ostrinia furnacalis]